METVAQPASAVVKTIQVIGRDLSSLYLASLDIVPMIWRNAFMPVLDDLPRTGGFEVDVLPSLPKESFCCPWMLYFCFDSWSVIVSYLCEI